MTKNMMFGAIVAGAVVLIGLSSLFSESDSRDYNDDNNRIRLVVNGETIVTDGSIIIEKRGDDVYVSSGNGRVNCTKNGGSVVVDRDGSNKLEIICD